jgi:hypothetical protein
LTIALGGVYSNAIVFRRGLQVCHRSGLFTGMMEQGNSPPFASLAEELRQNGVAFIKDGAKRRWI